MLLNCNKGFILTDLMLSLSCLFITITLLTPFIVKISSIQQDKELSLVAEEQLNQQLLSHLKDTKEISSSVQYPIYYKNKKLYFKLNPLSNKYLGCLYWNNSKNKEVRVCRYVPK